MSTSPGALSLSLLASLLLVLHTASTAYGKADGMHECYRSCTWPPEPKICRYEFTVEPYHSMSRACFNCPYNLTDCDRPHCITVNGVSRRITVVNREVPGPNIQVCQHDTVEVKVRNDLLNGEAISIHWHGILQRGTPHMDGVPLVTQCPIPYRSSYTYRFKAETAGTHYWHAHGVQRADGAAGMLVVRQSAPDDVHSGLYDYDLPEHNILLQDWINQQFMDRFAKLAHIASSLQNADSILINGRGRYAEFLDKATNETVHPPRHEVRVRTGERYRFRVASNAVMECPFDVSIDGHNLTVIASDGAPIVPVEVGFLGISNGERYDFVLDAKAPVGKYWLRVRGYRWCEHIQELALLVYEGASSHPDPPETAPSDRFEFRLNPAFMESSDTVLTTHDMIGAGDDPEIGPADVVHYLGMGITLVNTDKYNHPVYYPAFVTRGNVTRFEGAPSAQINGVTYRPPTSPLLTQPGDVSEFQICTSDQTLAMQDHCKVQHCECTHVIQVKLGQTVELVLIEDGVILNAHAMHLHGYRFQIVGRGKLGSYTTVEEVKRFDQAGNITRRTLRAPFKDTAVPPHGGFLVVRFVADNPGWWLLHCHSEVHFLAGMSILVHVGSDADLPPMPSNLPRCGGDWYPDQDDQSDRPRPTVPSNVAGSRQGGVYATSMVACSIVAIILCLVPF